MKPMLACPVTDLDNIKFPVIVSAKLDGIRCLIHKGKAVSRKLELIPNEYIQQQLAGLPEGLDGELTIPGKNFNEVQSEVMSEDGVPNFQYNVFDIVQDKPYEERLKNRLPAGFYNVRVRLLPAYSVESKKQLLFYESKFVEMKYEGIMIRKPDGPYKFGRSTEKEGYLLKLKRFEDAEGYVIGFEERFENTNEAEKDELGHTKRSSKKAGLVPADTLGALVVEMADGKEFKIGTGFDDVLRKEIWTNQEKYLGKLVTYQFQGLGSKGKPRFPSFKGFRDLRDL